MALIAMLIVCYTKNSFGQVTKRIDYTFALDTAKTRILPFDIPFTVKLDQDKQDPIKYVYLVKVNRYGNLKEDKQTSFRKEAFYPLKLVSTEEVEGKQYVYLDIPALKPDKRYVLLAVTAKEQKPKIKEIVELYCDGSENIENIKKYFPIPNYFFGDPKVEDDTIEITINKEFIIKKIEEIPDCRICEELKKEKEKADLVKASEKELELQYPYQVPAYDTIYEGSLRELAFITGLSSLFEIRKEQIFDGTYKLDTLGFKSRPIVATTVEAKTDAQRIANIESSLAILSAFRQSLLSVRSLYPSSSFGTTYSNNLEVVKDYVNILKNNLVSLNRVALANSQNDSEIDKCLNKIDLELGWQFNRIQGGTSSYHFFTRNSYFIKPDFGVIYYSDKLFKDSNLSGAAPFVGFHINFKATNEDVPFWTNFDIWRLLTLQIGVPVFAQNLSQDDSRRHLVADKFSIFTGAGINLAHTVRIHYGALWFQALQSVQGNERSFKVTSIPYIGFSIDIRLRRLFPGLSDAIFGVKDVPAY